MTKQNVANVVLWLAYVLALGASLGHVAWSFGTLEFTGQAWAGWPAAIAVDAGLAALAYAIQQRKRAKRPTLTLWAGVVMFASISAFANVLHALTVETGAAVTLATFGGVDALALARAVILSATLPLLVVYLGEVVSSDDATAAERAERLQAIEARKGARPVTAEPQTTEAVNVFPMSPAQARAIKAGQDAAAKAQRVDKMLTLCRDNPDMGVTELAREVGVSRTAVYHYVGELETAGRLHRNGKGWEVATA